MKIRGALIASFLALALGFVSPAFAQDADHNPIPDGAPTSQPKLVSRVSKVYESGKVIVVVTGTPKPNTDSSRSFGYRIGEPVPVTVLIAADPDVHINVEGLMRKSLSTQPTDLKMLWTPEISKSVQNGKNVLVIQMFVNTWKTDPYVVLSCEFYYATSTVPSTGRPLWKPASTPDFVIARSPTMSELNTNIEIGSMRAHDTPKPWLIEPLRYAAIAACLPLPLWLLWCIWRRQRPDKIWTRAERAWQIIDQVLSDRESNGGELSIKHLELISSALRQYLAIEIVPTSQVHEHLAQFYSGHEQQMEMLSLVLSALSKLDRGIYSREPLTAAEKNALVDEIKRIIPRQ